jgi:hypothetical protein
VKILAEEGLGADWSGGQWQKIAISRMFMRESDFMILDELTAALDAEAEYEIFSQIGNVRLRPFDMQRAKLLSGYGSSPYTASLLQLPSRIPFAFVNRRQFEYPQKIEQWILTT